MNSQESLATQIDAHIKDQKDRSKRIGKSPGRPKGTPNRLSALTLLDSIKKYTGNNFADLVAQGYNDSIINKDTATRLQYEKMLINKVVADLVEVTNVPVEDLTFIDMPDEYFSTVAATYLHSEANDPDESN